MDQPTKINYLHSNTSKLPEMQKKVKHGRILNTSSLTSRFFFQKSIKIPNKLDYFMTQHTAISINRIDRAKKTQMNKIIFLMQSGIYEKDIYTFLLATPLACKGLSMALQRGL